SMKKGRRSSNLLSIYVTTSSPSSYKIIYFFLGIISAFTKVWHGTVQGAKGHFDRLNDRAI
ncbi:MAG: hypothetical protein IJM03_00215, partial [Treponema sp.]|nr:hypothetical protein [Treponema sp.]